MIETNPEPAKCLLRKAMLKSEKIILASARFHNDPDINGVIMIGFEVAKTY
jgi:predicted nucleotide-binding protein (sugar kinase/HSP70/actin superfamily)